MSTILPPDQLEQLLPLLPHLAEYVRGNTSCDPGDLTIMLVGIGLETQLWALQEITTWLRILSHVKDPGNVKTGAIESAQRSLMLRGIPEIQAMLAIRVVTGPTTTSQLRLSVQQLDFGELQPGEKASQVFEVEGGPGRVVVDSDKVQVQPEQFGKGKTVVIVTVAPVEGGMLYTDLRVMTSTGELRLPVVAQWLSAVAPAQTGVAVNTYFPEPKDEANYKQVLPSLGASQGTLKPVRRLPAWAVLIGIVLLLTLVMLLILQGFPVKKEIPPVMISPQGTLKTNLEMAKSPTPEAIISQQPLELPVMLGTPLPELTSIITPHNASRVKQLARWGRGIAYQVDYSMDNNSFAIGSELGIHIYDATTYDLIRWIDTSSAVYSIDFSPDGEILASASGDAVILWRVSDGTVLRSLNEHTEGVICVAFSPDGENLASASDDQKVILWRVSDGTILRTLETTSSSVEGVAFSPDGEMLAWTSNDTLNLWRVSDGTILRTLETTSNSIAGVAFSPDGKMLASVSDNNKVNIWQISDGVLLRTLAGHTQHVTGLAFSPDGETLASASTDNTIILWKVMDGIRLRTLEGHTESVISVSFSPDGSTLASASLDKTVRLWRANDGYTLLMLEGYNGPVKNVIFSPDGKALAVTYEDNSLRLLLSKDGHVLQIIEGPDGFVNYMQFPGFQAIHILNEYKPTPVKLRYDDGTIVTAYEHPKWDRSIAFSADGAIMALTSIEDSVRLLRTSDGMLIRTLEGHTDYVSSLAFSPSGNILASASVDKTICLWDVSVGNLIRTFDGPADSVEKMAFSPDGLMLALSSEDGQVSLWRSSDGVLLRSLDGYIMAFSPDGQILALVDKGEIIIWRVSDWVKLQTWEGSGINSLAFSPDGEILASASDDTTINLWRVIDGSVLHTLQGHTKEVTSVAFSPDGLSLISGSMDQTIRLWGILEP